MKFNAEYFVKLANNAGIEVFRVRDKLGYDSGEKEIESANLWIEAFEKHERELLCILPDKNPTKQLDLFSDLYP